MTSDDSQTPARAAAETKRLLMINVERATEETTKQMDKDFKNLIEKIKDVSFC